MNVIAGSGFACILRFELSQAEDREKDWLLAAATAAAASLEGRKGGSFESGPGYTQKGQAE